MRSKRGISFGHNFLYLLTVQSHEQSCQWLYLLNYETTTIECLILASEQSCILAQKIAAISNFRRKLTRVLFIIYGLVKIFIIISVK